MGSVEMIVLDTHILIWWVASPEKLSKKAQKSIEDHLKKDQILVSSISVWEIYMLVKKGRLKLTIDVNSWFEKLEQSGVVQFVPVDNRIAADSVNLPDYANEDPADRMIIATARQLGANLLTFDKKILGYAHVQSL